MFSSRVFRAVVLFLAALPLAARASAAPAAGEISGLVRGPAGEALPGATVRVVSETTGVSAELVSDGQGAFRTVPLESGTYRVEVRLSGFETASRRVEVKGGETVQVDTTLDISRFNDSVVVTARRTEEAVQEVPIPVSVVSGQLVADTGSFNVNRLKELVPSVQFYSSNPRNSAVTIRGLGAPFGLTNDGLDAGVGLYVDGVFYARPAAATLDFIDVDRIEVLRGPQGTLFGKNTTAGAINVTTRRPSFTPATEADLSYGDYGFLQAKSSVTGPLGGSFAGRLSFSGTQRDGFVYNTKTQDDVNDLNNVGVRGQLLFAPSKKLAVIVAADATRQRAEGYTQVVAGVAPTLRPANRQYPQIAKDLGYTPPSFDAFDRLTDVDSPIRSYQDLGGVSLNVDWEIGPGQLTATTAWRYWNWDPSNDRDFIGLPVTTISAAPSKQRQWTQEIRYAGDVAHRVKFVLGAFAFKQSIDSDPSFKQEQGSAAARFLLAPTAAAATPGLLDGYGFDQYLKFDNTSAALFGQVEWAITDRLRILPGIRLNYDKKTVDFDQQVYGGLQTTNAALLALKLSVLAPQAYKADTEDSRVSGQISASFELAKPARVYATYATNFKSVGLNLNGVPTDAAGRPALSAATVRPERVRHLELGFKTEPFRGATFNVTAFDTEIRDFQAQVVNAGVGVLRGYLANAEKARVRGVELDSSVRAGRGFTAYATGAFSDGKYVSFKDAPPPLEDTGGPQVKDISGSLLPGISRWAGSVGLEYARSGSLLSRKGEFFVAADASGRSSFSSSPSASKYLVVDGYALVNARVGFRWSEGWALYVWARNLLDKDYFEFLTAAPGNTGLYVGQPGDPRTVGVTLRLAIKSR
ncbi:MAG: TonB-dependent receptor [Vicinamibacteria bacterium]